MLIDSSINLSMLLRFSSLYMWLISSAFFNDSFSYLPMQMNKVTIFRQSSSKYIEISSLNSGKIISLESTWENWSRSEIKFYSCIKNMYMALGISAPVNVCLWWFPNNNSKSFSFLFCRQRPESIAWFTK